jgi:hypothetical protein
MKRITGSYWIFGAAVIAMMITGCLLISGTFTIVKLFTFPGGTGFYHYLVDITEEDEWKKHEDDINDIDLVGFEMWFTNNEETAVIFNAYLDNGKADAYDNYDDVDANTTKILDGVTLAAGPGTTTHLTYGQSFKFVQNVAILKEFVRSGVFHFYGTSSSGGDVAFVLDSVRVVVTFTASD